MPNLSNLILKYAHKPNTATLNQDFAIELNSNLLIQIMSAYQLKASNVIGNYEFNSESLEKLVSMPPFHEGIDVLKNTLQIVRSWPKQLSWAQFNHQINSLLLAWLNDYKLGANLDSVFLLSSCLELQTENSAKFQTLLLHLIARVTNQLDQYKFGYVQNFDLETGLPNQQLLMSLLKQRLNSDTKKPPVNSKHFGLMLVNLNVNFDEASQINAAASNLMLAAIDTIRQHLSSDATIFHIGSVDLAIMIEPLNSPMQLNLIATKLIHAFESALPLENITMILTPYFGGISTFNTQTNAISLYEYARLALHHAMIKNERIKIYDQHTSSSFMNSQLLDEAIIEAFQQNELAIYLQPIVSLPNETCNSAEILLRWPTQEWESISPIRIVDTIYKKGFGKVFIRWLINNACQRCAELISQYQRDILLTVNFSGTDLLDDDLPELLAQSIALWEIPAGNLVIEITENDLLTDEAKVAQVLDKIVLLGFKLALDDFGTGYSSMARLRNMPLDLIKIDQSFVRNIATSNADREIVKSVIKLAHSLGKKVVAEGVEDLACLNILKDMKCEKIQGYYYAKPMSFVEFVTWLNVFEANHAS